MGIQAIPVELEVHVRSGLPSYTVVGLPQASVRESRDRVLSALRVSGLPVPRGAVTVNLGVFINTIISFLIVAFSVFLVIKGLNRMKREQEAPPAEPTTKECPFCFTAIPIKASRCPHCTSELASAQT